MLQSRFKTKLSTNEQSSFDGETHFFFRRKTAIAHNSYKLHDLHNPIARIDAIHSDKTARHVSSETADGLEPTILVAIGARVRITRNLWQTAGLVNGSVGTIQDFIYSPGLKPPDLPRAIIIQLELPKKDPFIFSETLKNCIPLAPIISKFQFKGRTRIRKQLPLRLNWGTTITQLKE